MSRNYVLKYRPLHYMCTNTISFLFLQEEDTPSTETVPEPDALMPLKRDRSFSEQDLAQFQSESKSSQSDLEFLGSSRSEPRPRSGTQSPAWTSMENKGKCAFPFLTLFQNSA